MIETSDARLSALTSNEILKLAMNSMTDAVFLKGLDGKYLGCNPQYEKVLGRSEAEIIGKTAFDLNDAATAEMFNVSDQAVIQSKEPATFEFWTTKADGTRTLFESKKSPICDSNGEVFGILGILADITKQRETEEALKAREAQYRIIAENASDAIWVYNLNQDRFTYLSPAIQDIRGWTVEEALSEKIENTIAPEFRDMAMKKLSDAKEYLLQHPDSPRAETLEVKQPTRAGEVVWVEVSAKLRFNSQNEIEILGVSRNINDRKRIENEIVYLGYHDQLTGLHNRHYFETIITKELDRADRYSASLSLLLLDLDHFKTVNDTWGHPVGDDVLRLISKEIENTVRESDIFVRFGGEEFIVMMPQTTMKGALRAAEKIRTAIEKVSHPVAGPQTVSIGVAQRMSNESFRHWYRRTDEALYQAKETGRNRVFASDEDIRLSDDAVPMNWRSEWSSGNKDIDKQHRTLIEIANKLINMSFEAKGFEETAHQVELLLSHIVAHFEFEEKVLATSGYPGYLSHAELHNNLVSKALRLNESYRRGEVKTTAFFSFVVDDVVLGHLMEADTKFFPFTNRK